MAGGVSHIQTDTPPSRGLQQRLEAIRQAGARAHRGDLAPRGVVCREAPLSKVRWSLGAHLGPSAGLSPGSTSARL